MDKEEYRSAVDIEKTKLKYKMTKYGSIALLGLGLSAGILIYDTARSLNIVSQLIKDPAVEKFYLFKEEIPEIKRQEELKILENKYLPKVERSKNVENIAVGVAGASGLYLILGWSIPLANYRRKRKSLEKQLTETSSE